MFFSYALTGSAIGAIFLTRFTTPAANGQTLLIGIGMACIAVAAHALHHTTHRSIARLTSTYAGSLIGTILAVLSLLHSASVLDAITITALAPAKSIELSGIIADAPDVRDTSIRYVVRIEQVVSGEERKSVIGKVLVTDRRMWPRFAYGDGVRVVGELQLPFSDDAQTGASPQYDRYLRRFGITTVLRARDITRTFPADRSIIGTLIDIRDWIETSINRLFPEPSAALLAGLLTGSRRGLPADITEAFRHTGILHITAISGTNVTLIISIVGGCLFFIPKRLRLIPMALAIVAFTLLVGASASVIRAAIMGALGLLALSAGRLVHMRLAILWTATFMLLWNPLLLWDDAGFQLSFFAVIGVTELGKSFTERWTAIPEILALRESLAVTTAATITTLPWSILLFGYLPLLSVPTNILVAPLIAPAMGLGFVAILLSHLSFPLGQIAGFLAEGFLEAIIGVAVWIDRMPLATVHVGAVSGWLIAGWYGGIVIWMLRKAHS